MKYLKYIVAVWAAHMLLWASIAFISLVPNMFLWSSEARTLFLLAGGAISFGICILINELEDGE